MRYEDMYEKPIDRPIDAVVKASSVEYLANERFRLSVSLRHTNLHARYALSMQRLVTASRYNA